MSLVFQFTSCNLSGDEINHLKTEKEESKQQITYFFTFLGATQVAVSVGRSVGSSDCRVTHSFDDPHVAPYWPFWPCSFLSFFFPFSLSFFPASLSPSHFLPAANSHLEILIHLFKEQVLEPVSILVVHQSVLKDSTIFVIPKAKERWLVLIKSHD